MEFLLLGPMELRAAGRPVPLGGTRQRSVLAALAMDSGTPVSVDTLIDRVWGQAPPPSARKALHVYIARIRGLLRHATAADATPARVTRRAGGYLLEVDPDRVDVHRFRRLVEQGRGRDCPDRQRVATLDQAFDLWHGLPLADLPTEWAARVRQGCQQQYLDAVLAWAHACLRVDDPGRTLARLSDLACSHPMVEALTAALMRTLYATGRPAEALQRYDRLRRLLADELGTNPGPELQRVHRQILTTDPELPVRSQSPHSVPRQLPSPPQLFTGRVPELGELTKGHDRATVVITAIDGMAGIGKTALAIHAAHQIADRYPDGQLFIDLHGYTQGITPIEPGEALDHLLRALGVPGTQIPPSLDQRAALYRTRLADQQLLIVLDNAATEAQVAPLLPGARGCLVLVTSRHRLAGLHHTHILSLDTLAQPDAVTLLTRTAGADRLAGQPPELSIELVELCGRLPLAIRIAAARLRSHPTWHLTHLVARLRDRRHRLVELAAGQHSVAAALDLSYQHLGPDQQHTYRVLGLHPGPDLDAYATAAMLDSSVVHASQLLDQLLEFHLLHEPAPGRYRFHDLTRAHAADTAARAPAEPAALERLLDYYLSTASLAMDIGYPYEREHRPQAPPASTPTPHLSDPMSALAWLDTELPNLLAAAGYAADHNRTTHVLNLSTVLRLHLRVRGHYHDAEALHQQALATATATGDPTGQLNALNGLGHTQRMQGRYEQAISHYEQALQIARTTGNHTSELGALTGLGHIHLQQGTYPQAADHFEQALQITRAIGGRSGELGALAGLGHIHRMQGRYEQAISHYEQALQIARTTGNHTGELNALTGLGHTHWQQGRHDQATDYYEQALHIARTTGNRTGELGALTGLGHTHRQQGRHDQAIDNFQQALHIARTTGNHTGELNALTGLGHALRQQGRHDQAVDCYQRLLLLAQAGGGRNYEFEARQGLGRLRRATGNLDTAITYHQQALTLARELSQPVDQARAHDGLAHAHHAALHPQQARRHWRCALDILTELGIGDTNDEQTTIAAISAHLAME